MKGTKAQQVEARLIATMSDKKAQAEAIVVLLMLRDDVAQVVKHHRDLVGVGR